VTMRRTETRMAQPPGERTRKMLDGLLEGKTPIKAAQAAGYGAAYSRRYANQISRSLRMKTAMLEVARGIKPGEIGDMAKARLYGHLVTMPKDVKHQIAVIRTGLEVDGQLGGPDELHLHQHTTLPPKVQEMLEEKMREILERKEPRTLEAARPEPPEPVAVLSSDDVRTDLDLFGLPPVRK
jgi:hypothetical protein